MANPQEKVNPDMPRQGAPQPGTEAPIAALSGPAVRAFAAAIAQRRIYPPDHPIASRALAALTLYLERLLALEEEWRLAVVDRKLLAGGRRVEEREETLAAFTADLEVRGIETIAFRRGLDAEELRRFVSLMSADPRMFSGTGVQGRLAQEGIRSIEAGRLVLQDRGETARDSAAREQTGADISEAYDGALGFIEAALLGFREGRKISLDEAEAFVHSIVAQIRQDRSPCLVLTTLKSHHAYTYTHIINVCILTIAQAEALGADAPTLREFGLASMMHDIGKSLLPREILSKQGKLTPEEFSLMTRHPQDGVHLLHDMPGVPDLALIVAFEHHMRYNNAGYPRRSRPRSLHPCSLMTNLADTYDAMRSRRSYQEEYPPEKVAALIHERAGVDYHPLLAQAFLQMMGAYPPGTRVRLNTGEEGVVARTNPSHPHRPVVRILKDAAGDLVRRLELVDLMDREQVGGRFKRHILCSLKASPAGARPPRSG
ncbi:MAG: HD domain-containing protein [Acidobacteria bacterium]|nr:HD domain-containing protein [Acidobacteriota bacterium]